MVYSLGAPYRHLMLKEMESAQSRTTARGKCIEARDEKGTRRSHSWPRPRAARLPCASGCLARELYNARCDLPVGTETFELALQGMFMRLAVTLAALKVRWRKRRSSLKY